jgi:hypothetical protein
MRIFIQRVKLWVDYHRAARKIYQRYPPVVLGQKFIATAEDKNRQILVLQYSHYLLANLLATHHGAYLS